MDYEFTETISSQTLKSFETKYHQALEVGEDNQQLKFEYAWCLIRSEFSADVGKGVHLLEELFKDNNSTNKRDYIYYLAVGNAKLRNYSLSLKYIDALLQVEPDNSQAKELRVVVDKRLKREAVQGAAVAGGILAFGGLVGVGLAVLGSKVLKK